MTRIVVGICTYNRKARLAPLVRALREQVCDQPFELLFVNNNSTDGSAEELDRLAAEPGVPLRHVIETAQGIVPARNRTLHECMDADYLLVMDDDELPMPGWVQAAVDTLRSTEVGAVGGRVRVRFEDPPRPRWLTDDLLGFLAELDHGPEAFDIESEDTPVWTSNVAYRMSVFRSHHGLRYDSRFNREGKGIGGGEDVMMFRNFLELGIPMRYNPAMLVDHHVEPWRLHRRYFLALHRKAGFRHAFHDEREFGRRTFGVPGFVFGQALRLSGIALASWLGGERGWVRKAMNATHALGMIEGYRARSAKARA